MTANALPSLEEREVQRLYQPWLFAHGSSLNVASHIENLAQSDFQGQGYQPRASRDKALTAFAQLVTLRLDVRRCMVSLIGSTNQFILAEANRNISIANSHSSSDDQFSTIIARREAICEHCMYNVCTAVDEDGQSLTAEGLIVLDCRQDDRFKDRQYVVSEPGVSFYAGVPLFSRNGYMIGAVAISDDMPRNGLKVNELKLMQETAQAVVEQLELERDRVGRVKGERIVRGMASFIEACSAVREETSGDELTNGKGPNAITRVQGEEKTLPRRPLVTRSSARRKLTRQESAAQSDAIHAKSSKATPQEPVSAKGASTSRVFHQAARILRESTLADGLAIFGATAASGRVLYGKPMPTSAPGVPQPAGDCVEIGLEAQSAEPLPSSDSEHYEMSMSDSDSMSTARPCKMLAFSIADDQARADVENGSALTLGTLEKYFSLFPHGKTFSFTDQGSDVLSGDESVSDREAQHHQSSPRNQAGDSDNGTTARNRNRRMNHKELLKKIPGAKVVVFLPLYDHSEERLLAGCFLWTSVTGRMMSLDVDLSYLRVFGSCIISEVVRVSMHRSEAAKTTFISSVSHELRSPLHGILGAAEFLTDTASDAYQSGLITSIVTCGQTLLDTLNHVLDYSKINRLGPARMRCHAKQNKLVNLASDPSMESLSMTRDIDLGILVEEVAEAVSAGHAFKKLPGVGIVTRADGAAITTFDGQNVPGIDRAQGDGGVSVLLDISPQRSWMVRTQPGALRRIIKNLLGNSLKYTSSGFVAVSLRAQEDINGSKVNALLRVVDSGQGMSNQFQRDRLFVPFSQEDPFQPGMGLGLSIVKSIVDSLGGSMEVKSQQNIGTEIDVHLSLTPAADHITFPEGKVCLLGGKARGLNLVLLEERGARSVTQHVARLEKTMSETCSSWFGMHVSKSRQMDREDADIYVYSEPPPLESLVERHRRTTQASLAKRKVPIVVIYKNVDEALSISRSQQKVLSELGLIVEVISQPCGPRKLAKAFNQCLRRAEGAPRDLSQIESRIKHVVRTYATPQQKADHIEAKNPQFVRQSLRKSEGLSEVVSTAVSYPSPPPLNPEKPPLHSVALESRSALDSALHVLLVDDNKVNRQLLVMFMKKHKFSYCEAENGQEALDAYKASCLSRPHDRPSRRFDFILMDISMPVMDGMEATRRIRDFEKRKALEKANVIALTGLASAQAQHDAEAAGIDVFLPKPVKFAELKTLLMAGIKGE